MCIVDHIVTAAAPSLAATYCWIEFLIIVQVDLTQVKNRPGGVTSDTTGNTAVLLCCLLVAFPQGYWPNMIFFISTTICFVVVHHCIDYFMENLELYSIPYPWPLDNGMDMDSCSRGYG